MTDSANIAADARLISVIRSLLDSARDDLSCLIVAEGGITGADLGLPKDLDALIVSDPDGADALDGRRFDLAIVAGFPRDCREERAASALLAKLRDRFAPRVLVVDDDRVLSLADYLALGFEGRERDGESRCFIHDPDSPSHRREWNDARHWANPENFDKYRW